MTVRDTDPLRPWRRLDWRFLLPSPDVGRVAVVGAGDEDLLAGLRLLGVEVVQVDRSGTPQTATTGCDVAVLVGVDAAGVEVARRATAPGGWVYAEAYRRPGTRPGSLSLMASVRVFQRLGLEDVSANWHAPSLAVTTRVLPLSGRAVLRDALTRYHDVRFGLVMSWAGRLALTLRVLPYLVPEGSVLGRVPADAD